ncbi:MAG: transketolase, partial [Proteobacteria bacterium]|nr:transketolase [Pseudomonadota bacterium]
MVIDGNDMAAILDALAMAKDYAQGPVAIIAKTFKGFGVNEIQDKPGWHGKPLKELEAAAAIDQLNQRFAVARAWTGQPYAPSKPAGVSVPAALLVPGVDDVACKQALPHGKVVATRKAFGLALAQLAKDCLAVWAVDADVKNSTFTDLAQAAAPERFVQCYIAEQNMVGVMTGLTQRGNIAFGATFAAFISRCYDQIRMAGIGLVPLRLCGS